MDLFFWENRLPIKAISESIQSRRAAKGKSCTLIMNIYMFNRDSKHTRLDTWFSSCVGAWDLFSMHTTCYLSYIPCWYDAQIACKQRASIKLQPQCQIKLCHLHYISSRMWQTWISSDGISWTQYRALSCNSFLSFVTVKQNLIPVSYQPFPSSNFKISF